MIPRPYQQKGFSSLQQAVSDGYTRICYQQATGTGKTLILSMISESAQKHGSSVWVAVPRIHLADQASEHLLNAGVRHNRITADSEESRAFTVHVCSIQTLRRRIQDEKIKNFPTIIIFDECHTNLDFQLWVLEKAPKGTIFIGMTATPELLNGRGLFEMYQTIIYAPTLKEFVELDYLKPVRYFRPPPIEGLNDVKRIGTEYDAKQLKAIFERKAVFGEVIEHYRRIATGRTVLVFTRSIELSNDTAVSFQASGIHVEAIHGKTPKKKQIELLRLARAGEIDGLATCDLLTYGIDIPNISCIIHLRPTESVALFYQINGRGLRPSPGKEDCIILDHVGNIDRHGHPLTDRNWNFYGKEKRKIDKRPSADILKLCQNCFLYYENAEVCPHCGNKPVAKGIKQLVEVDGRLEEAKPIKLADRPLEEKREFSDRINRLVTEFENSIVIDAKIVAEMLEISEKLDNSTMWTYHKLNKFKYTTNIELLSEIARQKKYKKGWIWYQRKELEKKRTG